MSEATGEKSVAKAVVFGPLFGDKLDSFGAQSFTVVFHDMLTLSIKSISIGPVSLTCH